MQIWLVELLLVLLELIIFFAGHGLASTDGKELYLLPQDGNPDRLKRTALSRTDLFKEGSGPEDPSFDYSRPGSYPTS